MEIFHPTYNRHFFGFPPCTVRCFMKPVDLELDIAIPPMVNVHNKMVINHYLFPMTNQCMVYYLYIFHLHEFRWFLMVDVGNMIYDISVPWNFWVFAFKKWQPTKKNTSFHWGFGRKSACARWCNWTFGCLRRTSIPRNLHLLGGTRP